MSKRGLGKFIAGVGIGVGIGMLFAPKSGEELRADLKAKAEELIKKLKETDFGEVKDNLIEKIHNLQEELKDLDKEKVLEIARIKAEQIKNSAENIYKEAVKRGKPIVEQTAKDLKAKTVLVLNDVIKKLEDNPKSSEKKKITKKKAA